MRESGVITNFISIKLVGNRLKGNSSKALVKERTGSKQALYV